MTKITLKLKAILSVFVLIPLFLAGCTTNVATGRSQFTPFMSENQEQTIGAQEHETILKEYGGIVDDKALQNYVTSVGQKIVPYTERPDINYTFTLLDSPVVNAFALPGGYVYITRGILTLANSEAELAAVMAHEIGHVTARHSAERYSTSIVTSIGASLLSAAIKVDGASQALGLGANLYLSSYSRSQEHEADDLGIRYISKTGYDPHAMARFLQSLEASTKLQQKEAGTEGENATPSYLSTHPVTAERIAQSTQQANAYSPSQRTNRIDYLKAVNGMVIGDSAKQGFTKGNLFIHPDIGFSFSYPKDYIHQNMPQEFIAKSKSTTNGGILMFSGAKKDKNQSLSDFLRLKVFDRNMANIYDFGTNTINDMQTASGKRDATVNNTPATLHVIVFEWSPTQIYRFTLAIPKTVSASEAKQLQQAVYSFKRLSTAEKSQYHPKRLGYRVAKSGDSVDNFAKNFPYNDNLNSERFRVINGMTDSEPLYERQVYKIITQ